MSERLTRPDLAPGFWNSFAPPASHVSALVQGPREHIDGDALSNAYQRDCLAGRRALEGREP